MKNDDDLWLEAIISDDYIHISKILLKAEASERQSLLHTELKLSSRDSSWRTSAAEATGQQQQQQFRRPLTVAAAFGSLKVVEILIGHGVDVLMVDRDDRNVIHCLVAVAFFQPHREEAVVDTYGAICRMLPTDVICRLLRMEEADGLRPIEFAARLGAVQLMTAIFVTPCVYVAREETVGAFKYQWFDVTEYELPSDAIGSRSAQSPLRSVAFLDRRHLHRSSVVRTLSDGVVVDWISRSIECRNHLLTTYSLALVLFFSVLLTYEMDFEWMSDEAASAASGGGGGGRMAGVSLDESNGTASRVVCLDRALGLSLGRGLRTSVEVFLCLLAALELICEGWFFYLDFKLVKDKKTPLFDLKGRKSTIVNHWEMVGRPLFNVAISLLTVAEIFVLHAAAATAVFAWKPVQTLTAIRVMLSVLIQASLVFFLQLLPVVGQLFCRIRKVSWMFVMSQLIMALPVFAFSHFGILVFNANSEQGCVDAFSSLLNAVNTLLLTFLNMFDYTAYTLVHPLSVYAAHVLYTLIAGLLLYNAVIAICADAVHSREDLRRIEMILCRLISQKYLEARISRLPLCRKLYHRIMKSKLKQHYFMENERIYLVYPTTLKPSPRTVT